jgi:acetyl-CoA acetyltransferase
VSLSDVVVLGVGMTRFGVETRTVHEMGREAGFLALDDAGISFGDVGETFTGYLFDGAMTGVRVMKEFGLTGVPTTHIENASATGLVAFREAAYAVASGRCEIAMALGFDKMTDASRRGGGPAARESIDNVILPAAYFSLWATRRMHERGTTPEQIARVAAKNWNHGALTPTSHRQPDHEITVEEVLAAYMVAEPHTAMMACPVDDGAACAIVTTAERAAALQPGRPFVRVRAAALQSERYTPGHTFLGPVVGPATMTRDTSREAYEAAGIGPEDVDLALCHDAFAIEELQYYELLGFCAEGDAEKLLEDGETALGGRIPFNTDGGLIARGHPGGPTGLAQIHEIVVQLRGEAGRRQVEGARTGLAHLVGGGSVCTVCLLQRD